MPNIYSGTSLLDLLAPQNTSLSDPVHNALRGFSPRPSLLGAVPSGTDPLPPLIPQNGELSLAQPVPAATARDSAPLIPTAPKIGDPGFTAPAFFDDQGTGRTYAPGSTPQTDPVGFGAQGVDDAVRAYNKQPNIGNLMGIRNASQNLTTTLIRQGVFGPGSYVSDKWKDTLQAMHEAGWLEADPQEIAQQGKNIPHQRNAVPAQPGFLTNAAADARQVGTGLLKLPATAWGFTRNIAAGGVAAAQGTVDELTGNYADANTQAQAAQQSWDQTRNTIGTAFGAGPQGILNDFVGALGTDAGGQTDAAAQQLRHIGSNVVQFTEQHPFQQAMNVFAIAGTGVAGMTRAAEITTATGVRLGRLADAAVASGDAQRAASLRQAAQTATNLGQDLKIAATRGGWMLTGGKTGDYAANTAAQLARKYFPNTVIAQKYAQKLTQAAVGRSINKAAVEAYPGYKVGRAQTQAGGRIAPQPGDIPHNGNGSAAQPLTTPSLVSTSPPAPPIPVPATTALSLLSRFGSGAPALPTPVQPNARPQITKRETPNLNPPDNTSRIPVTGKPLYPDDPVGPRNTVRTANGHFGSPQSVTLTGPDFANWDTIDWRTRRLPQAGDGATLTADQLGAHVQQHAGKVGALVWDRTGFRPYVPRDPDSGINIMLHGGPRTAFNPDWNGQIGAAVNSASQATRHNRMADLTGGTHLIVLGDHGMSMGNMEYNGGYNAETQHQIKTGRLAQDDLDAVAQDTAARILKNNPRAFGGQTVNSWTDYQRIAPKLSFNTRYKFQQIVGGPQGIQIGTVPNEDVLAGFNDYHDVPTGHVVGAVHLHPGQGKGRLLTDMGLPPTPSYAYFSRGYGLGDVDTPFPASLVFDKAVRDYALAYGKVYHGTPAGLNYWLQRGYVGQANLDSSIIDQIKQYQQAARSGPSAVVEGADHDTGTQGANQAVGGPSGSPSGTRDADESRDLSRRIRTDAGGMGTLPGEVPSAAGGAGPAAGVHPRSDRGSGRVQQGTEGGGRAEDGRDHRQVLSGHSLAPPAVITSDGRQIALRGKSGIFYVNARAYDDILSHLNAGGASSGAALQFPLVERVNNALDAAVKDYQREFPQPAKTTEGQRYIAELNRIATALKQGTEGRPGAAIVKVTPGQSQAKTMADARHEVFHRESYGFPLSEGSRGALDKSLSNPSNPLHDAYRKARQAVLEHGYPPEKVWDEIPAIITGGKRQYSQAGLSDTEAKGLLKEYAKNLDVEHGHEAVQALLSHGGNVARQVSREATTGEVAASSSQIAPRPSQLPAAGDPDLVRLPTTSQSSTSLILPAHRPATALDLLSRSSAPWFMPPGGTPWPGSPGQPALTASPKTTLREILAASGQARHNVLPLSNKAHPGTLTLRQAIALGRKWQKEGTPDRPAGDPVGAQTQDGGRIAPQPGDIPHNGSGSAAQPLTTPSLISTSPPAPPIPVPATTTLSLLSRNHYGGQAVQEIFGHGNVPAREIAAEFPPTDFDMPPSPHRNGSDLYKAPDVMRLSAQEDAMAIWRTGENVLDFARLHPEETIAKAVALYQNGLSVIEVGKIFGVGAGTVSKWLKNASVSARSTSHLGDPESASRAIELYQAGNSAKQIAKTLGVAHGAVLRVVKEAGILQRGLPISNVTRSTAIQMYHEGKSTHEVGAALGISGESVRKFLLDAGHTLRSNLLDPKVKTEAVKLYQAGNGANEVARVLGITRESVYKVLDEAGVKHRTKSEAVALIVQNRVQKTPYGIGAPYYSERNKAWSVAHSSYELVRMAQLDEDRAIERWSKSPDAIPYRNGRYYNPDFDIHYRDGRHVIEEIKPADFTTDPIVVAKAEAARKFYGNKHVDYRLVTEEEIGRQAIKNFDFEGQAHLSDSERARLRKAVNQPKSLSAHQNSPVVRVAINPGASTVKLDANTLTLHLNRLLHLGHDPQTRTFQPLTDLGIPHEVINPAAVASTGQWGVEPYMQIRLPKAKADMARAVAAFLGEGLNQDAVGIRYPAADNPNVAGLKFNKPDVSPFSHQEIEDLARHLVKYNIHLDVSPDLKNIEFWDYKDEGLEWGRRVKAGLQEAGYAPDAKTLRKNYGQAELIERPSYGSSLGRLGHRNSAGRRPDLYGLPLNQLRAAHQQLFPAGPDAGRLGSSDRGIRESVGSGGRRENRGTDPEAYYRPAPSQAISQKGYVADSRQIPNGAHVTYLNTNAAHALASLFGESGELIGGVNFTQTHVDQMRRAIAKNAHPLAVPLKKLINTVQQTITRNTQAGKGAASPMVHIEEGVPRAVVIQRSYHEVHHLISTKYPLSQSSVSDLTKQGMTPGDPLHSAFVKAKENLLAAGYKPEQVWREIPAHLLSGQEEALGVSPDESRKLQRAYFRALASEQGVSAAKEVFQHGRTSSRVAGREMAAGFDPAQSGSSEPSVTSLVPASSDPDLVRLPTTSQSSTSLILPTHRPATALDLLSRSSAPWLAPPGGTPWPGSPGQPALTASPKTTLREILAASGLARHNVLPPLRNQPPSEMLTLREAIALERKRH